MKNRFRPEGGTAIILAGILWGIIGFFSRGLSAAGFSSIQITSVRCFITAVTLTVFLLAADRDRLKIEPKDIFLFCGTGILSIVFFNICYFLTISRTTLSVAAILLYTAPCFVMIMSAFFFGEKITRRKTAGFFFAFSGCVMITGIFSGDTAAISGIGLLTGILSGFCYGLYSIFGRAALEKYSPVTVTTYTFITASIAAIPFSRPEELVTAVLHNPSVPTNAILLGTVSTLLPFLLYTKGLEKIEPGRASVMAFVEPMTATIVGIIIFHENLTLQTGIGILLIFLSVVLLNLEKAGSAGLER